MSHLILDIATAPLPEAAQWLSAEPLEAPKHYKDEAKIAAYIEDKRRSLLDSAALDADCCQITAIGWQFEDAAPVIWLCKNEEAEGTALDKIADVLEENAPILVTYNGFRFDLPFLMRRMAYHDYIFEPINLDRYRSPHIDLYDRLTYHGAISGHPLSFYARRFGWTDVTKPLTGPEEAQVLQSGRWDDLKASVLHDVAILGRLAARFGFIASGRPVEAEGAIL